MSMYKLYYDESDWTASAGSPYGDGSNPIVKEPMKCVRLCIIGDYAVGKTSIIKRLCNEKDFRTDHKTTATVDLYTTTISVENGSRKVKLELYDTPSMDQYKANVGNFCQTCHAAIIVYDISEPYSFTNIPNHLDSVRRTLPPNAEVFLMGAKSDLHQERKVTFKDADIFATKNNLSLFEISSKINSGLQDAFKRVTELIVERFEIGTFDPSTLIVPMYIQTKTQANIDPNAVNNMIRPNWSLLCCWL